MGTDINQMRPDRTRMSERDSSGMNQVLASVGSLRRRSFLRCSGQCASAMLSERSYRMSSIPQRPFFHHGEARL